MPTATTVTTVPNVPTGLVVGRFDPPHLGHSYLIEQSGRRCDRLAVFVNSGAGDAVPGHLRATWLAALHPDVTVVEVVHDLPTDFGDECLWQRWIALFRSHWPFAHGPDIVCSSDPYVGELATRLGAAPIVIDAARDTVPISATEIRKRPADHLDRLALPVRAWVEANWLT